MIIGNEINRSPGVVTLSPPSLLTRRLEDILHFPFILDILTYVLCDSYPSFTPLLDTPIFTNMQPSVPSLPWPLMPSSSRPIRKICFCGNFTNEDHEFVHCSTDCARKAALCALEGKDPRMEYISGRIQLVTTRHKLQRVHVPQFVQALQAPDVTTRHVQEPHMPQITFLPHIPISAQVAQIVDHRSNGAPTLDQIAEAVFEKKRKQSQGIALAGDMVAPCGHTPLDVPCPPFRSLPQTPFRALPPTPFPGKSCQRMGSSPGSATPAYYVDENKAGHSFQRQMAEMRVQLKDMGIMRPS